MTAEERAPRLRALTDKQMRVLKEARDATDHKVGLRVSYWPTGRSLFLRGLLEKRGRSIHRLYFITEVGRAARASLRGA